MPPRAQIHTVRFTYELSICPAFLRAGAARRVSRGIPLHFAYGQISNFSSIIRRPPPLSMESLTKKRIPEDARFLYSADTVRRMVLVTCGCTHTSTSYSPGCLIGSFSRIFFLSSLNP